MLETLMVGVDVSKHTLDICFQPSGMTFQITNDLAGFKKCLHSVKQNNKANWRVLVIMEHTGHYSFRFEKFLRSHEIGYCKIAALQIKRSLGVTRGKTDKIDAQRIAEYGWLRRETLVADVQLQEGLSELRNLLSFRNKLVRDRAGYMTRLKEMIATGVCTSSCFMGKTQKQIIDQFTTKIKQTEVKIKAIIHTNPTLKKTNALLQSIQGVGWIIAAYMIGYTNNFTRFENARKFNCYAGLAPFKMESGTSIAFRARVSHLANKEAKTLLNLAALSAIRCNSELHNYYHRRITEGKRKMSCLNIIRSKIVARMFAVIKRQSPYEQKLLAA